MGEKTHSVTPQFEILDKIDNPGSITLHVSRVRARPRGALVGGGILTRISKTMAHCALQDEEPDIPVEIVFIFKFTQTEAGAPKLVSTTEFMDSLAMVKVAERQARGGKA